MKFGHSFHRQFVPEWSGHYLDYNLLKCLIKLSKLSEAYQCLDASITSHDTFLRSHLDFRSTSDAGKALGLKKLEWFHEVNDRAIRRILAKLERLGQTENPSYRNIQERWQTLQPDWETRFASITEAKSGLVRTETATAISEDGLTQLHSAIVAENAQAASRLVDSLRADGGVSAREVISDALHLALRIQNDDIIHCLLRDGADLTYQSSRGEVALHVAVQVGRVNYAALIIQAMREQGATLDVPDNSRAWTPLFLACADGNAEVVQLLIKAGSNQKQQDRLGWTAKEIAAFRGHLAVADLFKSLDMPSTGGLASALVARHDESLGRINCGPYKSVIIVTLGTTSRDRVVNGVNLSFCSSAYSPGKYDVGSFILEISANGSSERRRVPLPILDDQINSPFIFFVSNNTEPCLVFSILQRMRVPGKEVLVASGAALLTRNSQQFGTHRQSLIREQSVPMMEKDTMRMAGHVTFTPLIVRPFPHLQIPQSIDVTRAPSAPPLLVGHRGAGANIKTKEYLQVGENTVGSFLSAVKLGATFVEFDIQITRDLQAVTFHDLSLSETGTDIPIHDVTLDQFIHASNTQSPHGNPLSMLGTAHSREQAGRPRSRSLGRQFEAGAAQIQDRMKHTVDFKQNGFKPNTRGHFIQDTFATLEEILVALPENIGCDIEIKYPRLHETMTSGVAPVAIEFNTFVDIVLQQLYHHAGNRQIILSSFTPEICILLAIKQKAYPVFFITNAGKVPMTDMEVRAASLQGAVHFAKHWRLAGIVFACETLILCPRLAGLVKRAGLVCATYGAPNNDPEMVKLQDDAGVDLIVTDRVGLIAKSLGS